MLVNLSNIVGANVADAQAIGTINNDDASQVQLSLADVAVSEGRRGSRLATFTVRLSAASAASAAPVSYDIATADGYAVGTINNDDRLR